MAKVKQEAATARLDHELQEFIRKLEQESNQPTTAGKYLAEFFTKLNILFWT